MSDGINPFGAVKGQLPSLHSSSLVDGKLLLFQEKTEQEQ